MERGEGVPDGIRGVPDGGWGWMEVDGVDERRVWARRSTSRRGVGHSLRSGGSSAAEAILVPRFRGNWLGGWSQQGRTRELHYLDPSVTPSEGAYAFFGWLLVGAYGTEPGAWERAPRAREHRDVGESAAAA